MSRIEPSTISRLSPSYYAEPSVQAGMDQAVQQAIAADIGRLPYTVDEEDRYVATLFNFMPLLLGLGLPLGGMRAVEVGSGAGLRAIGLSRLFGQYVGIELEESYVGRARELARVAGRDNLAFQHGNAADLLKRPQSIGLDKRPDFIVLHAVIEHLTLAERRLVLGVCREAMEDGAVLLVAETPNRLMRFDSHSSQMPFFQSLPPELALAYAQRSPRKEWRETIRDSHDPMIGLHREGVSVSFHEFDLFLWEGIENRIQILADGWSPHLVHHEPVQHEEIELADYFHFNRIAGHRAFSRYWIEFVARLGQPGPAKPQPFLMPLIEASGDFFTPPREHWSMPVHCLSGAKAFARHALPKDRPKPDRIVLTLGLDDVRSRGSFIIESGRGDLIRTVTIDDARGNRPSHWHALAPITLDAAGQDEIVIRLPDDQSGLVYLSPVAE